MRSDPDLRSDPDSVSVVPDGDDSYRTQHDMTEDGLTVTIALALAEVTDVDPKHVISDFTEYADPDALDAIFRVREGEQPRQTGFVCLTIKGHDVVVHSDGTIRIE